ncbi:MAG TPA: Ni/Fe hydrogenase subunit alpha [Acidimicrobiia bacterium]|nr:Ni/Fe hydrogenase subunit alpha [Acidimicrobiia bacterium]
MPSEVRTIEVGYLTRVEGEGAMKVVARDGVVQDVEFSIFEPPRFFEAFLRGRHHSEAPDITARICGICPVAYQMSAVHAMEHAFGVTVDGPLRDLRLLLYCGEWIESHALHVYLLHAPDFLGYESGITLAKDHPDVVARGLRLKKAGNEIVRVLGGREIHPVNVKVGGFYRLPTRPELNHLATELDRVRDDAVATVALVASFPMPDVTRTVEWVSLRQPDEYPMLGSRVASTAGLDIPVTEWNDWFVEEHVARSNALHSRIKTRGSYEVGPMARFALNADLLSPGAAAAAHDAGLTAPCTNPFRSIVVRAVETLHAVDEALRIIDRYRPPAAASIGFTERAGEGYGASEAPRGTLFHRYRLDAKGMIADAQIVPPTAQNQLSIEEDLRLVLQEHIDEPDDRLGAVLEQSIRNYDPCISCATHFLRLEVDRG